MLVLQELSSEGKKGRPSLRIPKVGQAVPSLDRTRGASFFFNLFKLKDNCFA